MNIYLVDHISGTRSAQKMSALGVDAQGISIMRQKSAFYTFRINGIAALGANILKQDMLSRGGEVAVPRDALYGKAKSTDILIIGTRRQFNELISKIRSQPFGLKECAEKLQQAFGNIERPQNKLVIGKKQISLKSRTLLMGVLNITPDSFSDGGKFLDPAHAIAHAKAMLKDGADIIDIGAESSRPGAKEISAKLELERIVPVLKVLKKSTPALISIDTTKATVAEKCLMLGAHMINDISGLKAEKKMAKVIARHKVPVVLMHRSGKSAVMQKKTAYVDVICDIIDSLRESIAIAEHAGIRRDRIIIDPGIGFGKTTEQNLEIIDRLSEFKVLGLPILIGASRKSVIGNVLGLPADQRLEGTLALHTLAANNGAAIIRAHDIPENLRALKMCDAIRNLSRA